MPAEQGALPWPPGEPCKTFLSHEGKLPLQDNSINRVIVCHTLEYTTELTDMLQEIWRVLTPSGRMLAIVPNRISLWSHAGTSPFSYGRPYSASQIKELMAESKLTCLNMTTGLHFFPSQRKWLLKIAPFLEVFFGAILPFCGGVWIIEAEKQIYASIRQPVKSGSHAKSIIRVAQPTS